MADPEDPTTRLKRIIDSGVERIEIAMADIKKDDKRSLPKVMALVKDAAILLGHVRRQEQADRAAGRGLTPSTVIAYLRTIPSDLRDHIRNEVDWDSDDSGPSESVLS